MASCPPHLSPDILLRYPLEPFFASPAYGTDCGFNDIAYGVLGTLDVLFAGGTAAANWHEVFFGVPAHRSLYGWNGALAFALMGCAILGFIPAARGYVVIGLAVADVVTLIWIVFALRVLFLSSLKIVKDASLVHARRSNAEFFGRVQYYTYIVLYFGLAGSYLVGTIACAVYTLSGDIGAATIAFRVRAASCACVAGLLISFMYVLWGRVVTAIERALAVDWGGGGGGGTPVVKNKRVAPNAGQDDDQHATKGDNNGDARENTRGKMLEVVSRFKAAQRMALQASPGAVILWLLHASILPMFWYLVLFHIMNGVLPTVLIWWLLTPTKRKDLVMRSLRIPETLRRRILFSLQPRELPSLSPLASSSATSTPLLNRKVVAADEAAPRQEEEQPPPPPMMMMPSAVLDGE